MTDDLRAKIAELRQRRKTAAESWGSEEKPGSAFLSYVAFASDIAPLLAAEAERLGAENERLLAALRPFATFARHVERSTADDIPYRDSAGLGIHRSGIVGHPTLGDCRRAAAVLEGRP